MLDILKITQGQEFVDRPAAQGVVSTLNMAIINSVERHMRAQEAKKEGIHSDGNLIEESNEINTIDKFNELEDHRTERTTNENYGNKTDRYTGIGFTIPETHLSVAAKLKLVRDSIAADLSDHIGKIKNPLTGKMIDNAFHFGQEIIDTLTWRLQQEMPFNGMAKVKSTALAMDMSEAEVTSALIKQQSSASKFLREHKHELIELTHSLVAINPDGFAYGFEDAQTVLDQLDPLTQLRILAAAIRGYKNGQQKAAIRYVQKGDVNAPGDKILGEQKILECWKEHDRLLSNPKFEKATDEAAAQGATLPDFGQRPKNASRRRIVTTEENTEGTIV